MIMKKMLFLEAIFLGADKLAADDSAAECDVARAKAKRHYVSLRHYFDALNHCLSRNNDEASQ